MTRETEGREASVEGRTLERRPGRQIMTPFTAGRSARTDARSRCLSNACLYDVSHDRGSHGDGRGLSYWYLLGRKHKLREHDDRGAPFSITSSASYCAEDEYTRLSRDIVVVSASNKFLVKKWGAGGHPSQARSQ